MIGLLEVAEQLTAAGLSVIPVGVLSDKRPATKLLPLGEDGKATWAPFQQRMATAAELRAWFPTAAGLAVVGGTVSGGLTIVDFDVREKLCLFDQFAEQVEALAPGLMARFPIVTTQSGGRHLYFRCAECGKPEELAHTANSRAWIETRAEGGYCLAPLTRGYKTIQGSLREVPTISVEERALLFAVARSLDAKPPAPALKTDSLPGAAYNARATLDDMERDLVGAGWRVIGRRHDGTRLLCRPGKDHGISATLGQGGHKSLYVFSSSAAPFVAGSGYSPFAVLAMTRFRGEYKLAAAQLARDGYGSGRPERAATPAKEALAKSDSVLPAIMTLSDLLGMSFAEPVQCVPGIIQEGCTLFAGRPKSGKSYTLLHLSLAVSLGGIAFGNLQTIGGDVLHLALEDGPRLLQRRFRQLLRGTRVPARLQVATTWPALDAGGLTLIEEWLQSHPDARMIVVDTLAAIRGRDDHKASAYRQDYDAVAPLTELAHKYDVAVVIAHHTRKMEASDVMDTISGTTGLTGAVDAMIVLVRQRFGPDATLSITGRDIEEHELGLTWDKELSQWIYAGTGDEMRLSAARNAIREVLLESEEALSPKDIAMQTGLVENVVSQQLFKMKKEGQVHLASRGKYYVRTGFVMESGDGDKNDKNRKFTPEANGNGHKDWQDDDPPDDQPYEESYGLVGLLEPDHQSNDPPVLTELTNLTAVKKNIPKCLSCGHTFFKLAEYDPPEMICARCFVPSKDNTS